MGLPVGIFGRCGVALAAVSVAVGLLLVAPPAFGAADLTSGAPKASVAIRLSAQPAAGSDSETTEAVAGADLSDDTPQQPMRPRNRRAIPIPRPPPRRLPTRGPIPRRSLPPS